MDIAEPLISWYLYNKRDLPWRNTQNPYLIWLSEIILQQTRVNQGMAYYLDFTESYPTVGDIAAASEDEVLKKWQGLGYYSRARNLLATARKIQTDYNGIFPDTYPEILKLKGIGPYTAAAIASFAYKLPYPVVDGNVSRVLSRLFDIEIAINSTGGKKEIDRLAEVCMSQSKPDLYNQAIMELGALVCTPTSPDCINCPLEATCMSRERGTTHLRPVKIKAPKARIRNIDYAVLESDNALIFKRRNKKDIWQGLHDFKEIEGMEEPVEKYITKAVIEEFPGLKMEVLPQAPEKEYTHLLSHQRIQARFWRYKISGKLLDNSVYFSVPKQDVESLAVPRLIHKYLEDSNLV